MKRTIKNYPCYSCRCLGNPTTVPNDVRYTQEALKCDEGSDKCTICRALFKQKKKYTGGII